MTPSPWTVGIEWVGVTSSSAFLRRWRIEEFFIVWASLVAQLIKNPPAVREAWVRSLGWEDPLEKGEDTHSSILAWRISWIV